MARVRFIRALLQSLVVAGMEACYPTLRGKERREEWGTHVCS